MSVLNSNNTDKFEAVFSNIPVPSTRTDKLDKKTNTKNINCLKAI